MVKTGSKEEEANNMLNMVKIIGLVPIITNVLSKVKIEVIENKDNIEIILSIDKKDVEALMNVAKTIMEIAS